MCSAMSRRAPSSIPLNIQPGALLTVYRRQMVGLARSGRTPESLATDFAPCIEVVFKWYPARVDRKQALGSDDASRRMSNGNSGRW